MCFTSLSGEDGIPALIEFAREAFGADAREAHEDAALIRATRALEEYGEGTLREFELELELVGSEFERRVWRELQRIPYGETVTYGRIAGRCGVDGGSRAVGRANGHNPVPIIVPCHRVVAAEGLGGFSGGLENKVRLLDHERAHASSGQGLLRWLDANE